MKAIWKRFGWGLVALVFAAVVSSVVCYLEYSNQQAKADYEVAYRAAPVTVAVTNLTGNRRTNLNLPNWVSYLFTSENALNRYLKDIERITSHEVSDPDCQYYRFDIIGVSSANSQMLAPNKGGTVIFYPGYDASVFQGDEYCCLVPVWMAHEIGEDGILRVSLRCRDSQRDDEVPSGPAGESESQPNDENVNHFEFVVVGTFDTMLDDTDEKMFYCPFETFTRIHNRTGCEMTIDSISAVLIDNYQLAEFQEKAYKWLAPADPTGEKREFNLMGYKYYPYAMDVDTTILDRITASLKTTLTINDFTAMLVFLMTAGAGFFLGFLMIRSRKREIILMRTLGKSNVSIYVEYALEQMLCIVAGTALGGLAFQWEPLHRLLIFNGIYFAGLSAALILFLNSKLLTTLKEDE